MVTPPSAASVSYTHLANGVVRTKSLFCLHNAEWLDQGLSTCFLHPLFWILPECRYHAVSYTHLDVYKRQEHITTAAAVQLLDEFENLAATVTLQHLLITLDDRCV